MSSDSKVLAGIIGFSILSMLMIFVRSLPEYLIAPAFTIYGIAAVLLSVQILMWPNSGKNIKDSHDSAIKITAKVCPPPKLLQYSCYCWYFVCAAIVSIRNEVRKSKQLSDSLTRGDK